MFKFKWFCTHIDDVDYLFREEVLFYCHLNNIEVPKYLVMKYLTLFRIVFGKYTFGPYDQEDHAQEVADFFNEGGYEES